MIDSTNEQEGGGGQEVEEKEEETANDHPDGDNNPGNNTDADNIVNGNEGIRGGEYVKFYEQYLYSLLPAIYQEYDTKENNVLHEFLKIIGSQAATIRQDIDGLLNNFFINSSDEWVIPYIADLIAAKVVPNSSLNNRLDVQNTIRWRKVKGTQMGLVDLIRNTINGNAKVKEAFRYCSSFSHLAFGPTDIAVNKPCNFVNLHDQDALSNINTENDIMPHTIDVREPTQTSGWYNIKNILIFMPQLNIYHIGQVQVEKEDDGLRYYFSNILRKQQQQQQSPSSTSPSNYFPLYDLDEGVKIRGNTFAQNPYKYFGKKIGMSVKIDNILAACVNPPTFSPVELNANVEENLLKIRTETKGSKYNDQHRGSKDTVTDPDFVSLHKVEGIRILEPRSFSGPDKRFIIRLYCLPEKQEAVEIANYNTSKMSYHPVLPPPSELNEIVSGSVLISLELDSKLSPSEFPETVIALRDSRKKIMVKDNIMSKYQNALYVYLPSILLNNNKKKYFLVDRDGSTFEVKMINGRYDTNQPRLGRIAASSQIFPPRQLTYSLQPLHNFVELNRFNGIKAVDAKKYGKESFDIEAIAINRTEGQAWKIGRLEVKPGSLKYINEKEVWIQWRIILGHSEDLQPKAGYPHRIYKELLLPACHFKATRLALDKNFEEPPDNKIEDKKKIEDIVKNEILPESARDDKVGTFHVHQNEEAAYEYEVKIFIRPEHYKQFEYLVNEIKSAIKERPEFVNEGKMMLRIKNTKTSRLEFPLSEIILTNRSSRSVLVYLPQLKFDKKNQEKILYVADDGSTSNEEDLLDQARMSAGQIIPIANKYPLQQRIPVYTNLTEWQSVGTNKVHSGELAIDPEHGRFAFSMEDDIINEGSSSNNDGARMHVTADYNYAFSHDVGAGAYDRRDSLKKPTKWVSKNRHCSDNDAFPSKTFETIADALASAKNDDVIQVEDSATYNEDNNSISNITLPPGVRVLTLQAANWTMPVIKVTDRFKLDFSHPVKRITLNGILITGGPLTLHGNFDKLDLVSCTVDPGYDGERFLGIRIEQRKEMDDKHVAATTNTNSGYMTEQKESNTSLKEISLNKSISGGIVVDDSVSIITVEDSIVDNLEGSAIDTKENNKREKNPILKLEARRSDILSDYQDPYILELRDICCTDSILTSKVSVSVKEKKQNQTYNDDYDGDGSSNNSCTSMRYSRYEPGSRFEKIRRDNDAIVDFAVNCTPDRPIFVSTTFGDPGYLHLHHLSSKSILERAENTLEMGAFNKDYKPLRIRNLNLRLREFLPLGIKSGVIYVY